MAEINPYKNFVSSITPTDYEKYCTEILKGYAEAENLKDFTIQHNTVISSDDGTYQLDIYATFVAMGVQFKVIAECKRYSSPVSREKVVILADKVKSLGAHKGILISTSGFQSGAHEYAQKHGIALLQILDKGAMHILNAREPQTEEDKFHLYAMMEEIKRMPDYYAYEYHNMDYPDRKVYPTPKQIYDIRMQLGLDLKKARLQQMFLFLESKRILTNPFYMERKDECVYSVLEIKKKLTEFTQDITLGDMDIDVIRSLIVACNEYLDSVRPDTVPHLIYKDHGRWADVTFDSAMKKFRAIFKTAINKIEKTYDLEFSVMIPEDY